MREARKIARSEGRRLQEASSEARMEAERKRLERLLAAALTAMGLEKLLRRIAAIARNISLNEWLRIVRSTLGVELDRSYYSPSFYEPVVTRWEAETRKKLNGYPAFLAAGIATAVLNARDPQRVLEIVDGRCLAVKRAMASTASSQTGTIHAGLLKLTQTDAGVNTYIWSTMQDSRVRDGHRALEGQECSWDDPPDTGTGNYHPGEEHNCRCTAIPVFDRDTLSLPVI